MALQLSDTIIGAMLNVIETTISPAFEAPRLKIYTGSPPATVAAAATGSLLVDMTLPGDWMAAASGSAPVTKVKAGTWEDTSADGSGNAGYFRIFANDNTTPHIQGTVTATGGGGDMTLDSIVITAGQTVTITTFTLSGANWD